MSLQAQDETARLLFIEVSSNLMSHQIMTTYQRRSAITTPAHTKMASTSISFDIVFTPTISGMASIKVRASQFSKSVLFDTDVTVFPQDWCKTTASVRSTRPKYKELNRKIRKTIYDLEGFVLDHEDCSLSMLKRAWDESLITTDWYEMVESKIRTRNITQSTRDTHLNILRKLRLFKPECSINELTDDFFEDFINDCRHDVCDATLDKYVQTLKCYYNIARELYGSSVPYCNFSWHKTAEKTGFKIKALGEDDIRKIENWVCKPNIKASYRLAMHRFLFLSYSGMRVSDFNACTGSNISVEDGVTWLTYTSIKTHTFTRVPISTVFDGRAKDILTMYENDLDAFFRICDRCHFNEKVKAICKNLIGIEQKVTTHCGRHTFATRLVNREVPITTIAKVCGHRKITTTMIYANTSEQAMVRHLSC